MSNPPTALIVFAHHRNDSLTAVLARRAAGRLAAEGYAVDLLDLHAEGFDPRGRVADEPDYGNRDKRYSAEVHAHADRVLAEYCDIADVHTQALFDSEGQGLHGAARERHYADIFARADDAVDKLLAG